jgi:hypothetical protein
MIDSLEDRRALEKANLDGLSQTVLAVLFSEKKCR